jgi:large subunit ribosomal protein L29
MKAKELRIKDDAALQNELVEMLRERFNFRMQQGTKQLKTSHRLKEVNRDIARIKTILNERKGAAE